ncbi:MAG: type II CAAX endopeptidase family protein [Candidatus Kapabacteria bacterium]|nr:type II CAAX endopeptidase family protein [Candidatus Kapabacteria bacterium]
MKKLIPGILIAIVFWFVMFSPLTAPNINFWLTMLAATGSLTIYSFLFGRKELLEVLDFKPKWILIGIISAAVLYMVFFTGNIITKMMFDFAERQVGNIYATKSQASRVFIGLSLLLWIGPSEEIFWRGFIQNNLTKKYGDMKGFIFTTLLYTLVHIWGFNLMLLAASLFCGLFWGWMYMKYKSLTPGLISHAIWDLFIFVIIPVS